VSQVRVPAVGEPAVSVVMLTYGGREWVEAALRALVDWTPPVYELVVVDNASPDGTGEWLAGHLEGAKLVRNSTNVGFGPGVNQGALHARAPSLCLLNSDALVTPGWLPAMVACLEQVEACGAVVPMLLNLDGTLQEAGAVVGREGTTMSIGWRDDACRPWYRFPRYVPYGSGACLVMRRSDFLSLGGFDPVYGKGYFEDVDLCFELASAGLRVVYEPRAVVRHVRGASSSAGFVARLREGNREAFRQRWGSELSRLPSLVDLPRHPYRAVAARDVGATDRLLLIGDRLPRQRGGSRLGELALGLARVAGQARVTVVGLEDLGPAEEASWLLDAGVELIWGVGDWQDWMRRHLCHFGVAVVAGAREAMDTGAGGAVGAARAGVRSAGGDDPVMLRALSLLERYQPQAAVVLDLPGPEALPGVPSPLLARAEELWCQSSAAGGPAVVAPAGGMRVSVVGPEAEEGMDRSLAAALARLGVVPTGPAGWPAPGAVPAGWPDGPGDPGPHTASG
jgi:GT2 family glycosyltransferase